MTSPEIGPGLCAICGKPEPPVCAECLQTGKELIAWRCWNIGLMPNPDGPSLTFRPVLESVSMSHNQYDTPIIKADEKPTVHNGKGIYCWRTKLDALREYSNHAVYGAIALSGHIVEMRQGFRAEMAIVRKLFLIAQSNLRQSLRTLNSAQIQVAGKPTQHVLPLAKMFEQLYDCSVWITVQYDGKYMGWDNWQKLSGG